MSLELIKKVLAVECNVCGTVAVIRGVSVQFATHAKVNGFVIGVRTALCRTTGVPADATCWGASTLVSVVKGYMALVAHVVISEGPGFQLPRTEA